MLSAHQHNGLFFIAYVCKCHIMFGYNKMMCARCVSLNRFFILFHSDSHTHTKWCVFVVAVFISFVVFFSILSIRSLCFRRFGRLPRFWWWYYVCSSSIFHRLYSIKTPKIGFYCGDIRFRIDDAMMCCLVCRVCVFIGSLSSLNIQCLPNCLANAHTTFAVGIVVVVFAFSFF